MLKLLTNVIVNYLYHICGSFNKFPDFFVLAFIIAVESWKFSMLLLYILWEDYQFFFNDFRFKWTAKVGIGINPTKAWLSWWISKIQSRREDTIEERYEIKLCFKLGKNNTRTECFRLLFINRASVFEWHKRFKEDREYVSYDERCGRSKEIRVNFYARLSNSSLKHSIHFCGIISKFNTEVV